MIEGMARCMAAPRRFPILSRTHAKGEGVRMPLFAGRRGSPRGRWIAGPALVLDDLSTGFDHEGPDSTPSGQLFCVLPTLPARRLVRPYGCVRATWTA